MADLVVSAVVKRPELLLADLALHNFAGGYEVAGFGAGAVTWRRQTTSSPLTPGERLVSAVKDTRNLTLTIRSYGTTANQLNVRMQALCRAFEQFDYELHLTIDGVVLAYACQPADYAPLGATDEVDKYGLMARQQATQFEIPVHPTPIFGGL